MDRDKLRALTENVPEHGLRSDRDAPSPLAGPEENVEVVATPDRVQGEQEEAAVPGRQGNDALIRDAGAKFSGLKAQKL